MREGDSRGIIIRGASSYTPWARGGNVSTDRRTQREDVLRSSMHMLFPHVEFPLGGKDRSIDNIG